jgi:hypothetical protein
MMRTIGILAIFVLALCAVGEGAALFRLSRQVTDLRQQVARPEVEPTDDVAFARPRPIAMGSTSRPREAAVAPRIAIPAFTAPPATTPATTSLREALATAEGREQLKAALSIINEEKRQDRLVKQAEKRVEGEQKWKERILKNVQLTGDEPLRLDTLFATLKSGRAQILEDMRAGLKTSDQADKEIDELQDGTQKGVRALLGDERAKKLREQERKDNGGDRRRGDQPRGQNAAQAQQPPKPVAVQ